MKIHIDYEFTAWNEYINAERTNKYLANKIKQQEKAAVVFSVKERYTGNYPVTLTLRPHFKHRRRDLDNFRMKGLIDGLVAAGVIENDNLTKIDKIVLEPILDGGTGVEVEIKESKSNQTLIDFVDGLTGAEKDKLREIVKRGFLIDEV